MALLLCEIEWLFPDHATWQDEFKIIQHERNAWFRDELAKPRASTNSTLSRQEIHWQILWYSNENQRRVRTQSLKLGLPYFAPKCAGEPVDLFPI